MASALLLHLPTGNEAYLIGDHKMSVYTHNTKDTHEPCTFVKQIVTDAALEDLNLSDDWFEIDPEEVADIEELTGMDYAEADGYAHLLTETTASGHTVRKYGRL
jgi:hypothetical protein